MESNIDINEAAAVITDAEKAALTATASVLAALVTELDAIAATLPDAILLDAKRIINSVKGDLSYRISTELPLALSKYDPNANLPSMMVPPPYNPNA